MKKIFYLITVLFIFSSCQSHEEKQRNAIQNFLSEKGISSDRIKSLTDDSATVVLLDYATIDKGLVIWDQIQKSKKLLDDFQNTLNDGSKRVWLKTMTPEQHGIYEKLIELEKESLQSWESFEKATKSKKNNSKIVVVEYRGKFNRDGIIKDILYFNNPEEPYNITGYHSLTKEQYNQISNLIQAAKKADSSKLSFIENAGYDIVPIDEDPSKSKEERAEIKRIQAQKEWEEAQRKRQEEIARNNREIDNKILKDLRTVVRMWNQETPFKVDDITIAEGASLSNSKIYYKYKILGYKSDLSATQWNNMKTQMTNIIKSNCQDVLQYFVTDRGLTKYEVKESFQRMGITWTYVYRDLNGTQLFTIEIKASDLN